MARESWQVFYANKFDIHLYAMNCRALIAVEGSLSSKDREEASADFSTEGTEYESPARQCRVASESHPSPF
jgi:hypothetical protein